MAFATTDKPHMALMSSHSVRGGLYLVHRFYFLVTTVVLSYSDGQDLCKYPTFTVPLLYSKLFPYCTEYLYL